MPFHVLILFVAFGFPLLPALSAPPPLEPIDPGLRNLSRPDINLVAGLRLKEIASSPVLKSTLAQMRSAQPGWGDLFAQLTASGLGEVEEILITARRNPPGAATEESEPLVLLRGKFSGGYLAALLCSDGCESEIYRDIDLYRCTSSKCAEGERPTHFAFLDATYAALGDAEAVRGAIDRHSMETESVFSDTMNQWIERLSRYHFWLAAEGPFSTPDAADDGPGAMAAAAAGKIDGVGFGLTLGDEVEMGLELRSASEQEARQLYELAEGMLALNAMQSQQQSNGEKAEFDWLKQLTLRQRGPILSAALRIPQEQLQQKIRSGEALAWRESSPTSPVRRKPRREGGIRIYGLKEEPVEVPTQPAQP